MTARDLVLERRQAHTGTVFVDRGIRPEYLPAPPTPDEVARDRFPLLRLAFVTRPAPRPG